MSVYIESLKIIYTATALTVPIVCYDVALYCKTADECHYCRQNVMVSFVKQTQECFAL